MNASYIRRTGPPEVLTYGELPDPEAGAGQVLVEVRATALNHLDVWRRSGSRGEATFDPPLVLGSDVAGVVVEAGAGAGGVEAGSRVMLDPSIVDGTCDFCQAGETNLCRNYRMLGPAWPGGYAEYVAVPAENVHVIPESLSFEQAAAMPLTFQTAYHMLVTRGGLRAGDRVLVQAAGSGVGSAAIQIAKALGAWVITTAGSDEKVAQGLELGADTGINYRSTPGFSAQVIEQTDGHGVDIVIDHVGGAIFDENIASLRRGGTYVNCGVTDGDTAQLDIGRLLRQQIAVVGSFMGTKAEVREWMRLVRDGTLRGVVAEVFPLSEAAEAHRRMESRSFFGKLILLPQA